jgi:primosomal protein N' (replication factor Y)
MDSDVLRRGDYEEALEASERRIDVLVGTQMIAKGLDFPRVTVVGVINADQALHLPTAPASGPSGCWRRSRPRRARRARRAIVVQS